MNLKKSRKKSVMKIVFVIILLVTMVFNTTMYMKYDDMSEAMGTKTTKNIDRAFTLAEGTELNTQLEAEGATLLYNMNNTLPLSTDTKVTILGASSHNYVQGGTGSAGGRDDSNTAMLDKAFANAGIDYNQIAWSWMTNALGNGSDIHNGTVNAEYIAKNDPAINFNWTSYSEIHEFTIETYQQFVTKDVIGDYKDVAVVTFARSGAEGASPSLDYDGNLDTTTGTTYLELNDDEKDLLKYCKENFTTTVVLINSAVPIETGFINNAEFNVGAVLWIGHPGEAGMYGVANILSGKTNPSGHLVDTWTYDMSTNPTYYSANDQTYSNIDLQSKNKYYQYNEGIYVGYRFYETADSMGYFDSDQFKSTKFKGNLSEGKYFADTTVNGSYEEQKLAGPQATYNGYEEVVLYPFGYGLSYTNFEQKIKESDVELALHGENSITVSVKNTGKAAGKDVVQIYMQAPYQQDENLGISGVGLEKAQVVLVGFAKTDILEPGESQEVTVNFSTDDLTNFDEFGQGCYVLEKGDYIFHVSPNAHGWANEATYGVDYESINATLAESYIYNESADGPRVTTMNNLTVEEGIAATNAMNDITAGDGTMLVNGGASGTYTLGYLSRSNFASGMTEIMSYQSDDRTGVYSGNGSVWSIDASKTTPVVTGDVIGQRAAAEVVKQAIVTTPLSLEKNGISEGMEYDYQSILAEGITFGDKETSKKLYGYGNDAYINMMYTRDGLTQNDEAYLTTSSGIQIQFNAIYYVALNTDNTTVKDTDGYVKIYDAEADASKEGTAVKLQAEHMAGVPSSDTLRWDKLANMLSFSEADNLIGDNGWHTQSADSVGKVFSLSVDGPGEAGNAQNADCTWWPCAVIIAATWNTELAEAEGVAYGHQDLLNNTPYCYAPAMNIHRTPFGGRDFEYYSEDGLISGIIGGYVVQGLQSTGMHVFIKHCALNDSDTNRGGVETWADEMSIREIYAKPYEISTKFFDADGIMGSLNSMGMAWAHTGFYQDMMRDEWKWNGMLITDGDGSASDVYNNYSYWIIANFGGILGMSGQLSSNTAYTTISKDGEGATNYINYVVHTISRNALYQYSHNIDKLNAITMLTPNKTVPSLIWIAGDAVLLIGLLITFISILVSNRKKKMV